jgi:hypothetical protein
MPANTMPLSVVCVALLAPFPALCQMPGPGGAAERARLPSSGDWARPSKPSKLPNLSRSLPVEADTVEHFSISDEKKRQLEEQISKLKSICPNCSTVVTLGGTAIVGANVAGSAGGCPSIRHAPAINFFSAQEAKCATLPVGMKDVDCVLVSKALYEYLRGR